MTPRKWTSILISLVFLASSVSYAQQTHSSVKRNIATVLFASLGGAILGLSTLSFYGEPEEHTDNITTGALIGFIGGVGYVAYDSSRPAPSTFDYSQVGDLDQKSRRAFAMSSAKAPLVQFKFDF
ncbi:hypothetical protein QJS83_04195 [Bdellovibrio sp. 22V]|uniref:hypothetical protein n=1 Tax=Bdellovibrio TaxID=958 RepID=UPI002543EA1D|nr:hypothetical protein [Bdellovibrio sp. 22V]WII73073.1 hypothetical protein QJS83_04195 [Bdellovibrio sp. 22V]